MRKPLLAIRQSFANAIKERPEELVGYHGTTELFMLDKHYIENQDKLAIGDEPDPINPNAFETDIKAELVTNDYGVKTFKILNGVTGYEEWELARILAADDIKGDFLVCAGTKGRWDKLAIHKHEWVTFSKYAKELLKISPDMAQINVQAQNLGTAMERLGVSAQDASKSLRHAINCIPEEIWEMLESEIKRRGI